MSFQLSARSRVLLPRLFQSLRSKLVCLVLVTLIPLVTLQLLRIHGQYRQAVEWDQQLNQRLAEATSAAFTNYLNNLWRTELVIGSTLTLHHPPLSTNRMESFMREQLAAHPTIMALSWVNPKGAIIASTDGQDRGKSLAGSEYIQRLLGGWSTAISDQVEDRLSDKPSIAVARAIRRQGELAGIVVAHVRVELLGLVLPVIQGGENMIVLTDRQGRLVFASSGPVNGETVPARGVIPPGDGALRPQAAALIPHIGWTARASVPVDEVLAPARNIMARDTVVLLLVAATSLLAARALTTRICHPISALRQAAKAVMGGDLTTLVNLQGADELALTGRALNRMARRIRELEAQRSHFLRAAAHELRNPMAGIKGLVSLLSRRMTAKHPVGEVGDILHLLEIMEHEVDRLSSLLNEILEAFQLKEGQLLLKLERVNLVDVVNSALVPFWVSDDGRKFVFTPDSNVSVWGDFNRLRQVVSSLITNAVKYSPDGSEIRLALYLEDGQAVMSIQDSGLGIPEKELDRVFDEFYRGSNVSGHDPGGLGLDLFICKNIVRGHKGRIWAENNEGKGSTFFVALPLYFDQAEGQPWHAS